MEYDISDLIRLMTLLTLAMMGLALNCIGFALFGKGEDGEPWRTRLLRSVLCGISFSHIITIVHIVRIALKSV